MEFFAVAVGVLELLGQLDLLEVGPGEFVLQTVFDLAGVEVDLLLFLEF